MSSDVRRFELPRTLHFGYLVSLLVMPVLPAVAQEDAAGLNLSSPSENSARVASREAFSQDNGRSPSSSLLAANSDPLELLAVALRNVVSRVRASVVHIEANKSSKPHGNSEQGVTEAGSGAIVCIQGTTCVLSNFHVVRDCATDHIQIVLTTGRRLSPKRVLGDSLTDVAVLMLPADQDLVPIPVADSNDVEIGDFVLAFGSPFGLSHSVSHGIVSAKGRRNLDLGIGDVKIQDFIQTDAAINPGNSGGPLLNLRGELIGLNTAIASNSGGNDGIAFSIPSSLAHRVAEELIQRGRVARPYLGVHLEQNQPFSNPIPFDRSQPLGGARVTRVNQGSMAAEAGVLEGDVIARVNGQVVSDEAHLRTLVGILGVEGTCNLTVVREGKCIELPVALRERMQR